MGHNKNLNVGIYFSLDDIKNRGKIVGRKKGPEPLLPHLISHQSDKDIVYHIFDYK
jgi:hypothetical protein